MIVHELSRADARRIAVRAQRLDRSRPAGLLDVVRQLTLLRMEPTSAIAPSADLVAWSRLGSSYAPAELDTALAERKLIELRGMIRPSEDLALYRAAMAEWPGRGELRDWQVDTRDWVEANDACRQDILARLDAFGPLTSRDLPDSCKVPWSSSGWNNNRNVVQLLGVMARRGEVAVAGRKGRERLWDLASRVYPDDPVVLVTRDSARRGLANPRSGGDRQLPARRRRPADDLGDLRERHREKVVEDERDPLRGCHRLQNDQQRGAHRVIERDLVKRVRSGLGKR